MEKSILYLKEKKWIIENFPAAASSLNKLAEHSSERYLNVLDVISSKIPFNKPSHNECLCRFLYFGCLHFGRWGIPTPNVITPDRRPNYERFVRALNRAEHKGSFNIPVLQLHSLRDEIYDLCEQKRLDEFDVFKLTSIRQKVNNLRNPATPTKGKEFSDAKSDILKIIDSLIRRDLATVFEASIPFILSSSTISIKMIWKGINATVTLKPVSETLNDPTSDVIQALMNEGVSRWQDGSSEVTIQFAALIDGDAITDRLDMVYPAKDPNNEWAKCFTIFFEIINEVIWQFRITEDNHNSWIPSLGDIRSIKTYLLIAEEHITVKIKFTSANMTRIYTPSDQVRELDFRTVQMIPWSIKCSSLTKMYLKLGETNEALFWLNVAIEAMFKEKFIEICNLSGNPDLHSELSSPKAFWADAEDILISQFPELSGKVHWPDTEIHVSIYAKLKYIYKKVKIKSNIKDLLTHYRVISKKRNELFHGNYESRVAIIEVVNAIDSFNWIQSNMVLADEQV